MTILDNNELKAALESEALSQGTLEERANFNAHNRREGFRDQISVAAKAIFWLTVAGIAIMISTYVWHLITPESWYYISADKTKQDRNYPF